MKRFDVVCIGSGISSLTAAIMMAMNGRSVAVLEQHYVPGGYMHAFRKQGHSFDTGAHYVGAMDPGQPFRVLLEHLGVYKDDIFLELDPNGFDEIRFPEFQIRFGKGYERNVEALAKSFPGELGAIREYFRLIQSAAKLFPTYNFRPESDYEAMRPNLETSLRTVVEGLTQNPKLRSVLYAYCALHGTMPGDLPFGLHAVVVDSLLRGAYGFRTNGNALAQSFVDRLRKLGGELFLNTAVTGIEVDGDLARKVITDQGEFEAEWVIGGIHPKTLFGLLRPDPNTPLFKHRLEKLRESMGIFGLYAVCRPDVDLDPKRNYYFFSTSDPAKLLPEEPDPAAPSGVFVSRSDRASLAPASISLNFHAAGPYSWFREWEGSSLGKRPEAYRDFKAAYADKMLSLVEERGVALRESLAGTLTSSALSSKHFNPSPEGSAYGLYHSFEATGLRALGPRTKVKNLLLTGQSTLFPGLLAAAIAGLRTSGSVLGVRATLAKLEEMLENPSEGPRVRSSQPESHA